MTERSGDAASERGRMKDVDHTPPHGDDANAVWERGEEHAEDDGNAENAERRAVREERDE
ncbi:MAG: hypothetical protein ABEJ82_02500 [Haloplanus sp.]